MIDPNSIKQIASNKLNENKLFLNNFTKKQKRLLDELFHSAHHEVFEKIDCLECANCCKTLGPRITESDLNRMAKALKLKASEVQEQYLRIDEDGDLVFKSMPCPFLLPDNYCMIYESRPKACREYPHTDRPNMVQIKKLTLENSKTCPAVYEILELIKNNK